MGIRAVAIFAGIAAILLVVTLTYKKEDENRAALSGWNSDTSGSHIAISDENATATRSGPADAWQTVLALPGRVSGKWYFRVRVGRLDKDLGWIVGIATTATPLSNYLGSDGQGVGFQANGIFYQGSQPVNPGWLGATAGQTVDIAVDLDAHRIWATVEGTDGWNGSPANSPSTGTGGRDISYLGTARVFPAFSGWAGDGIPDAATLDPTAIQSDPALSDFKPWLQR